MKLLDFEVGINQPFFLIAGPCVVESESLQIETAGFLKELCKRLDVRLIFKSSFDKANRSSASSFRGLGMEAGLRILEKVKKRN
jgi:2-dehydro-3-deoxyphosphooctonate aldolase (KDO 8-P synthase)